MAIFFDNGENGPAHFTGLSTGSWSEDIDLTADANFVGTAPTVPAGATGVILRFVNPDGTADYDIGCRKPGSTTNRIENLYNAVDGNQTDAYCGITSSTVDLYIENAQVDVYLLGYFTAEAEFLSDANQLQFNTTLTSTWETLDLSAKLSADADFAIIEYDRASSDYFYNFRHPSSTDDRTLNGNAARHCWMIVPCSGQNVECWSESTLQNFVLVGQITSNATVLTNGEDASLGTTGSYQTVDFGALATALPSDAVLAIVEIHCSASSFRKWGVRRYADTSYADLYEDAYSQSFWRIFPVVDIDDTKNERCQAKVENADTDFFVWGYIANAAAGGLTIPIARRRGR